MYVDDGAQLGLHIAEQLPGHLEDAAANRMLAEFVRPPNFIKSCAGFFVDARQVRFVIGHKGMNAVMEGALVNRQHQMTECQRG